MYEVIASEVHNEDREKVGGSMTSVTQLAAK